MLSAQSSEPRWRRLPEERPRQIIDAALDVFGERGLAAARLEDIARRAGVSKGTIYLYFPNKEALFTEMIRSLVIEGMHQAHERVFATADSATAQLRTLAAEFWNYMRSPTFIKLHRFTMAELRNYPALLEFYMREVAVPSRDMIADIIRRGITAGEFREVDESVAARVFQAALVHHGLWCAQREQNPLVAHLSDVEVRDQVVNFFLGALGEAPTTPSAASAGAPA